MLKKIVFFHPVASFGRDFFAGGESQPVGKRPRTSCQ